MIKSDAEAFDILKELVMRVETPNTGTIYAKGVALQSYLTARLAQPQVTDEMVNRAHDAWIKAGTEKMRAALEAALSGKRP